MEDKTPMVEILFEKSESYVKVSAELLKLKIISRTAEVVSSLMANVVVIIFVVLFFVILNIGVSLWIGETMGKPSLGFLIVAAFYLLMAIIVYMFRNTWIKIPVRNNIIIQGLK